MRDKFIGNGQDYCKPTELVLGADYDTVIDSTVGLVQIIKYFKNTILIQTVTITYTDSCKDQYTMVVT